MRRIFVFAVLCSLILAVVPPTVPGGAAAQTPEHGPTSTEYWGTDNLGEHTVGTATTYRFRLFPKTPGTSIGYFPSFTLAGKNPGDFQVTNTTCPVNPPGLGPNETCTYDLVFTPKLRGTRTSTLTIACPASSNCPLITDITGTGTGPCGLAFGDVKGGDPACEAIEGLAARGVIKGCDQTASPPLFCPNDPTLRAQMAALIARAVGWDAEDHTNTFPDRCLPNNGGCIDDALWRNVGTLQFYGAAKGFQDGTYNPFDKVLYAQTISFITRAMVKKGYWTQATVDDGSVYPNIPASSGHRLDFVTYVAHVGPVPGTASTTQNFAEWNTPSTRTWFALALWQAIKDR